MKVSKRDINLLIGFLGILIAFCAYQFGYRNVNAKVEELNRKNVAMEAEIAKYEAWEKSRDTFVTETEVMEKQIVSWLGEFPANNLPEDDMKLAYQMDNRSIENYLFINSMDFTEPTVVFTTDYSAGATSSDSAQADASAAGTASPVNTTAELYPQLSLYQSQTSMGVDCSYQGIKDMIERVYSRAERKSIEAVLLSYDETTGQLTGSLVMNDFFVYGLDKAYTQPALTPVREGTDNIFGSMELRGLTIGAEETETTGGTAK